VLVAKEPLEILRTIHSFDPCLACSTHVYNTQGEEVASIKIGGACYV
jgi:hydrogenase large subunit